MAKQKVETEVKKKTTVRGHCTEDECEYSEFGEEEVVLGKFNSGKMKFKHRHTKSGSTDRTNPEEKPCSGTEGEWTWQPT